MLLGERKKTEGAVGFCDRLEEGGKIHLLLDNKGLMLLTLICLKLIFPPPSSIHRRREGLVSFIEEIRKKLFL